MVRPLSSKSSKLLTSRGTNWGADATSAWGNGSERIEVIEVEWGEIKEGEGR